MKKFIVLPVFLVMALAAAAGAFFLRDGLERMPWAKAESFDFPEAVLTRSDGSCVIFDRHGTRMLSVDRDANLLWSFSSGAIYGSFLSADMDSDGTLYLIDQQPDGDTPFRFERIMRVSQDGSPAGVLGQSRVQGRGGYVAGSLRAGSGALWYLGASEDGLVTVTKMNIKDNTKQTVVKTEWALSRAVLAVDGPEGAVVVNAGGGLVRFVRGRFEALAELSGPLPYPVDIRYDKEGNLMVADAANGVISRVGADGTATVLARQKDASALSALNPAGTPSPRDYFLSVFGISAMPARLSTGSRIDAFSPSKDGVVSVDRMNGKLVFFDAKGLPVRLLTGAALSAAVMQKSLFAWALAGASLFFALLFLIALSIILVTRVPRRLAPALAALPGAALVLAVVAIIFVHDYSASLAASQAAVLGSMRGMAASGALLFDPGKLEELQPLVGQSGNALDEFKLLAEALQRASVRDSVKNVTLYKLGGTGLTAVCDSAGTYPVGFPQRFVPDAYYRDILSGKGYAGTADGPSGRWLLAAMPVKNESGTVVGVVEFSKPAAGMSLRHVLASALADNVKYLSLVALGLVFAGAGSLFTMVLRPERKGIVSAAGEPDVFSGMKTEGDYSLGGGFDRESHLPAMRAGDGERFEPDFDDSGMADGGISDADVSDADASFGIPELDEAVVGLDFEEIPELPGEFDIPPEAEKTEVAGKSPIAPKADTAIKIPPFAIPSAEHQKLHRQAIAALQGGQVDAAVVLLERILEENPEDSRALNNIGVACKRQGRLSAAIGYLEKALALEPGNADTRANLDRLRKVV